MAQGIGYYLEGLDEWANTPQGSTIIGNEASTAFQDQINNNGRLFGLSAALNAQGAGLWEKIGQEVDPTAILDAAFIQAQGKSSVLKNRGDSSKWFYAQNFQIADAKTANAKPNEVYAGVAAVLWSVKQLYPSIDRIPVFDSYYVKSLGDYDVNKIQTLLSPIFKLQVTTPPKQGNWNFISTLHDNGLLKGFIGDVYALGKEGKFPTDAKPFSTSIPYALQSTWDNLPNEGSKITTDYYGSLPVNGSVHFPGTVPNNFDGSDYLIPTNRPLSASSLPAVQTPEANHALADDNIQIIGGVTQLTAADDVLINQSNFKLRMMGGNDFLEVIGGKGNFANGNMGEDTIILRGGSGEYLGGRDNDTFEVFNAEEGTSVNGNMGNDTIVLKAGSGKYLGGGDRDTIYVVNAEEGTSVNGNRGEDRITGHVDGVVYRGGKDNDLMAVSQGETWGDNGSDTFRGVTGEGYAVIKDYTVGEDVIDLTMSGSWSQIGSGLMFTDDSGDQIMLLVGITDIEQVTAV
ncbi:hypothetical protein SynBIOSE41_02844 [Synechococcus sp. BIOS-E4-1]|uniref:calcium-binding protein n=1 Tax=Synechococcus sp. BIOS-E4-1 TaxID=1400864 RepID=UPI00164400D2|nr:calcium-binding protein [Synechococcus sp. BIOS-E4-1]QNI55332.1 hypothetical protein SynBIOSE41_02844 [Synechococcus sp. BIOS-E4-1]